MKRDGHEGFADRWAKTSQAEGLTQENVAGAEDSCAHPRCFLLTLCHLEPQLRGQPLMNRNSLNPAKSGSLGSRSFFGTVLTTLAVVLAGGGGIGKAYAGSWADLVTPEATTAFRVSEFLGSSSNPSLVVLEDAAQAGLLVGQTLTTYRAAIVTGGAAGNTGRAAPLWAETGRLKITEVQAGVVIARVEATGSELARAVFPAYPGLMAGDIAVSPRTAVAKRIQLTPTTNLGFFELFEDPKSSPSTFELSAVGSERLRLAAKDFAQARLSLLMIEGHTDRGPDSNASQLESYQRALTVRQYLVQELGFDERRVVAIGFGGAEPRDETRAPGDQRSNRRIVLKALALPEHR